MTLNITDAELHEWARMRADDAGRLARELVACRQQSQAAVAAAYEAAAQAISLNAWSHLGTDCYSAGMDAGARHQSKVDYDAIRALATPDQIAALAAKVDVSQAPNPAVNGGRCQSDTITLPRAEVEALMEVVDALDDEYCSQQYGPSLHTIDKMRMALLALQEHMK